MREDEQPTLLQAHVVDLVDCCLRRNLSGKDYEVIACVAYNIGACLPDAYDSAYTYGEIYDCVGSVLFVQNDFCLQ